MTAFGELAAMAFPNVLATFGEPVAIHPQLVDDHAGRMPDTSRPVTTVERAVLRLRLEKPAVLNAWDAQSLSRRPTMAGECSLKLALGAIPFELRRGDVVVQTTTGARFEVVGQLAKSRSSETWTLAALTPSPGEGA
ncbi:hypothetical protein RUR49_19100 [Pseudoxanthobacter sp. M-2]|uniref:hypothetical protein n=1 Tax=Pseudoxanthobacter sp. M-2 TaxID=3078754 RepID=UPI0038FCC93F